MAFRQQYFGGAFKADSDGRRTSERTGVVSEYGTFIATEAGRVVLTTKPDPTQGGAQGEALVHAVKLQRQMFYQYWPEIRKYL